MKVLCLFLVLLVSVAIATDRQVLISRTIRSLPLGWTLKETTVDEKSELSFIVALKQQNLKQLEELFWDVSDPESKNYRNFLEIDDILSIVSPSPVIQFKVINWLNSFGVKKIENRRDSIHAIASLEVISKVFETKFAIFEHKETGRQMIRQFGELSIPSHLSEIVDFVAGLSEFPTPKFSLKRTSQATSYSIAPQSLQSIYKFKGAKVTFNSSVGVIEFEDQYYAPSDLSQFANLFGVRIPALDKKHIIGYNDPTSPQIEATLDIQAILSVGNNATGWFWIEKDNVWLYDFANHMFNTKDVPLVNTISYGWNEEDQCEDGIGGYECSRLGVNSVQYVQRVNVEFQKVGLRGITLICASGDSGANGRTDPECSENHLNPVFPAASPYITSVGATQISGSSGRPLSNPPRGCAGQSCAGSGTEEAVSYDVAMFTSGGGFSDVALAPKHQKAAINAYFSSSVKLPPSSYFNKAGRGFPDVAAFGNNVLIFAEGSIQGVGGTSASAPIFGGVVALLNDYVISKSGKPLGFVSPLLYKMAAERPTAFFDVVKGDNICTESGCSPSCKGFYAAKGWDPVTGLGTPVYPEMLAYLKKSVLKEE